ncbi:PTS transporter subunit IIC [Gracilinema caldarium]|uniref:PTS system Galactitol-specific IIC component n=1 Tax=Gracilinema caldarium (strain ATCC 51460 / DSM 7334 / H1) TaxID=744872 RepID=F8F2B9_GRAC1|nr:PTS transporter subunit IIC [Gracilinema caldarium]AEJ20901.1 PTS system Galactitol-specific IIC component [Gracilinema caldarium DSM 7334]
MQVLSDVISWIFSFKVYLLLPILFFIIALFSKMPLGKALLQSLKVGIGFAGVFLIFDAFLGMMHPAVQAMVEARNLQFPIIDAGWPPLAAITWSSWIAPLIILLVLFLNVLMLLLRWTTVFYIDIWNYWHFALIGSMLMAVGIPLPLALAGSLFAALLVFKMSEMTTPYVQNVAGITGVSISPLTVAGFAPWAIAMDAVIEKIPGLRWLHWNPSRSEGPWAVLGEPMIVGLFMGLLFGYLAAYDVKQILETAVKIAAIMFLLPHCGSLIGDATGSISRAASERMAPLFGRRTIAIAMDTGFLMKIPSVIVTGMLLMPISLALAFVLPGNKVLPAGDLPNLMSIFSVVVLISGGNVIRAILIALPVIIAFLYSATALGPLITELAQKAGTIPGVSEGSSLVVSSFTDGGNPLRFWIFELFRGNLIALVLIVPVAVLLWYASKKASRAQL